MRRAEPQLLALAVAVVVLAALAGVTRGDVIFHVPEVLVRHAAVPRPVGTGSTATTGNTPSTAGSGITARTGSTGGTAPAPAPQNESEAGAHHQRYEYFVEHSVSAADAKKMATQLKLSDVPASAPGCGACSAREMEYCETRVLADHCCCERHFLREPFPWLPHTCYLGPHACSPLAASCAHYARLRDCCCLRKLAEHWKGILSQSARLSTSGVALLLLSAVLVTVYI